MATVSSVEIARGYVPGSIGRVSELHAAYYQRHWGFGLYFEAKVASELAAFLQRYDGRHDGFWTASVGRRIEGSVTIDGISAEDKGAHLRWFILSDALRGKGVGGALLDTAMAFCRVNGFRDVYLWTFAGLDAARHLYEKAGFTLAEERQGSQWGTVVTEQRFVARLS